MIKSRAFCADTAEAEGEERLRHDAMALHLEGVGGEEGSQGGGMTEAGTGTGTPG